MSEELKHGIPKAICIGETKYTKEEREKFHLITNIYLEQIKTLQHTLPKPKAVF